MHNESSRDYLRSAVAQAAARLIAEGLTDYHAAKKKAARQLGISEKNGLPDNHEIEKARPSRCLRMLQPDVLKRRRSHENVPQRHGPERC